jgi:thiamine biosynthesis protein ThiS
MEVMVNDNAYQLPDNSTIATLIEHLPPQKPNTVVALNHRVVCSKRWKERQLCDGDRIITFQMLGGG